MPGVAVTYVGLSWSIGGDGNIDDTITLTSLVFAIHYPTICKKYHFTYSYLNPNRYKIVYNTLLIKLTDILRNFNPHLKGYSTGTREKGFNAAVPGARAK